MTLGSTGPCWHVVDFGCGTGNLLLPLAATFPQWRFTGELPKVSS